VSQHVAFRRQPVPQQVAQAQKTITIPAPTRGIVLDENDAFMQPGAAIISENWAPTLRGIRLRGGSVVWTTLPAAVVSGFEYVFGAVGQMFAATADTLYDVTAGGTAIVVKAGQTSGNYSASQMATIDGNNWLIAVNETGDAPLRLKNGATWVTLPASGAGGDGANTITGPGGIPAAKLCYVWKYRNRFFFIEVGSMNAWYLPINSVGGELNIIPLSGSATRGGKLVAGATWSVDAGDGIDDKCVFLSDQGEVLIFTGSNPGDPANWRQEGRYHISPPMGMNAILPLGGDLLIVTVDGIVPVSQAITKDAQQLELAMLTRPIKPLWRETVNAKRDKPWSIRKWDEYGGIFVATPGGTAGNQNCLAANDATGAWTRFTWDATCFLLLRGNMYFGTQSGKIMQADRTGYDDGVPYVCTLVGGWEMFQSHSQQVVWHQARAIFTAKAAESFQPQLSATTDFVITIPQPPAPGPDPGVQDLWDQGTWDHAKWDQATPGRASFRNTMWVSIGMLGFSHAPVVQVTVAQQAKPDVELIAIAATFEQAGVTV